MTKQKQRRVSDSKDRLIDEIVASKPKSKLLRSRKQIDSFLRQYFADVPVEDMEDKSLEIMARAAVSHLEFGGTRKKGQPLIRVFNPTRNKDGYESLYTFVEVVNDDMPFLVDSVSAAINRQSLAIHITVHPVLRVKRDARGRIQDIVDTTTSGRNESFIRFAIDKETDLQLFKVLEHEIHKVLGDIRAAVSDWARMRSKMVEAISSLANGPSGADPALRDETEELLKWLVNDHFTFLGYREYALRRRKDKIYLRQVAGSGLGILRSEERGSHAVELTKQMGRIARAKDWLILTKANSKATVHRHSYLDYIGIKVYDESGNLVGEKRFLGLFTSIAYSESPRNIPLLRLKVQRVIQRSHLKPSGHRSKALMHILDTFPRDELFQSSIQDLVRTTTGILNLQDRQRVRFFLRRDTFRRFYSCIVYIPREKYSTAIRRRVEQILLDDFGGISVDSSVQITDAPLARVHLIVRTAPGDRPRISIREIEQQIADSVTSWRDTLRTELTKKYNQDVGLSLFRKYGESFPVAYEEDIAPDVACRDVRRIDQMIDEDESWSFLLYHPADSAQEHLRFKTFQRDRTLYLSTALPILEDLGTGVHSERPYRMSIRGVADFWIQDFLLHYDGASDLDMESAATRFQECFRHVLAGDAENDGFNRLILAAGLDWRQVALVRCYAKYLAQLRIPFSQDYMEDVLASHADFASNLVTQFELQFDPSIRKQKRERELRAIRRIIARGVARARNLDEDRILSAFSGAVNATLRTNYYQPDDAGEIKPYISIKLDPDKLPEAPLPKPKFEIFVYSPIVEGVHLRGGEVARGGIRWSDRRADFRTEVLGLMKAQVVKNTVIVPTGAKGGFVPKRLPDGDRDALMSEVIRCYKIFISGLLDLTDNVVKEEIVAPPNVVRRDADDPYLVVAADKGTATFSDIANQISAKYDFWLDDAFASGGSAGYDHKKMGITARGAWEAVSRHFRELGINVQTNAFTVIGIGDMSGDVFGNGMLLSKKIKLVAAFNHEFIFIDPDPDMAASFRERKRLFRLPRSKWTDYDEKLMSKGGGIYSRQAKNIRLSNEARKLLDTDDASVRPLALIRLILKMDTDLLWNGGVGTYVKASSESHADVGDKSNDNVRVNADELRCKVIGEGGNLGLTQRARIEFSLNGGHVNTDFIDNSAGVDSSDREVNIKILLRAAEQHKKLTRKKRDILLEEMTDDVARLVLRNNYLQTQAISMMEARAGERLDETALLIINLERTGLLDRSLEFLPDETEIDERRQRNQAFTRPEFAIVLSYAKIDLYNGLIESNEGLEDFLTTDPQRYFPPVLRRRYADLIPGHRLSRQILATLIANNIVNRMGPAFVKRVEQDTEADCVTIARAYVIAREVCQAGELLHSIEALDNKIPATVQQSMMFEVSRILRHACYWLIEKYGDDLEIESTVQLYKPGMAAIYARVLSIFRGSTKETRKRAADEYVKLGVPPKLANQMAAIYLTRASLDIADLANVYRKDVVETAKLYADLSDKLDIPWIYRNIEALKVEGRWQAMARSNLRDEIYRERRHLAAILLRRRGAAIPKKAVDDWINKNAAAVQHFVSTLDEMKKRHKIDFATLSVAQQELRRLSAE
ncbi:MAG: NAD-glutamate dehydrogenase [Woeseia sp.]